MPVDVVGHTAPTAAAVAPAAVPRPQESSLDQDAFLRILAAQIQNQNPMNDGDPIDFMATFTQYAMLNELQLSRRATELQSAAGLQGTIVTTTQGLSGLVTGFVVDGGKVMLLLGEERVPLSDIQSGSLV